MSDICSYQSREFTIKLSKCKHEDPPPKYKEGDVNWTFHIVYLARHNKTS